MAEPLTGEEIHTLAVVFPQPAAAGRLLLAAGLGTQFHPQNAGNAFEYWHAVSAEIGAGRLVDGRRLILTAAVARYPANEVFRRALGMAPAAEGAAAGPGPSTGAWTDATPAPPATESAGMNFTVNGGNVIFGGRQGEVIGVQNLTTGPDPQRP
ncbi:effector-associated domain EAD1-containing protein [Parafrankia discariae]|uniref:effector-associated domain EAD1-containing protein n=1 Tax=Parafrankia discariae TaxID=365528 RepID=UPI0003A74B85|nr:effector-associated domain EAD1-containing protein [Parafrankia discariae]